MIPGLASILHAAAQPGGKTYAEWQAHIATRTSYTRTWTQSFGANSNLIVRTTASAAASGVMYGSPWGADERVFSSSVLNRIVQHSMASLADFNGQISNGGEVLIVRPAPVGFLGFFGRNRNGYNSESAGEGTGFIVTEVSYWNFVTGEPETIDPSLSTGPTPYSAPGW